MNSAQSIYRGELRLSFNVPFLGTSAHGSTLYCPCLSYIKRKTRREIRVKRDA